jgi:hypothetical protein
MFKDEVINSLNEDAEFMENDFAKRSSCRSKPCEHRLRERVHIGPCKVHSNIRS